MSIKGLSAHVAANEEDALALLFEGEANRAISEHALNKVSSSPSVVPHCAALALPPRPAAPMPTFSLALPPPCSFPPPEIFSTCNLLVPCQRTRALQRVFQA